MMRKVRRELLMAEKSKSQLYNQWALVETRCRADRFQQKQISLNRVLLNDMGVITLMGAESESESGWT